MSEMENSIKNERIAALYSYMGFNIVNDLSNAIKHDYLTENVGRDGRLYYWYMDEARSAVICIETGLIIADEHIIDVLFC